MGRCGQKKAGYTVKSPCSPARGTTTAARLGRAVPWRLELTKLDARRLLPAWSCMFRGASWLLTWRQLPCPGTDKTLVRSFCCDGPNEQLGFKLRAPTGSGCCTAGLRAG